MVLPVLLASRTTGLERPPMPPLPPEPHAIDVWLGEARGMPFPARAEEASPPEPTVRLPGTDPVRPVAAGLGSGFLTVGGVGVLEGDGTTVRIAGTQFGLQRDHLAAATRRFIQAFGDDYDQIAVFLAFNDVDSAQSLAYQMPVKNDVDHIGLGRFDASKDFGSPSGKLETVLNMKRILIYGRSAADDPDNGLYAVWAQEAAHRWIVYFRLAGANDDARDVLLGRQKAHWAPYVQADASFMDGIRWIENADGTYSVGERGKRYSPLDQYGMGLRTPDEVPPFFILDDFSDQDGRPVERKGPFSRSGRYKARRIDLTIDDVIRGMNGARSPARDPAAEDLRMGVMLLGPPGTPTSYLVGEASRIDNTRKLWADFYNNAGDGRGKVCTELLRPCRGPAFSYGAPALAERTASDGVVAPGETFKLDLAVHNVGNEAAAATVTADAQGWLVFDGPSATASLAPGAAGTASLVGRVPAEAGCGVPFPVDVVAPARLGPSKSRLELVVGLVPGPRLDLEAADTGTAWRLDPDGTDTATSGRWAFGTPERTERFEFVLQPGAAFSGGTALVTAPAAGAFPEANALREGTTTAESPALALAGLRDPHVAYRVYFVAADFANEVLVTGQDDALVVQASIDGVTWQEIDRVAGMATGWQRRVARLAAAIPDSALAAASTVKLRFVATNGGDRLDNPVEVVVDDVELQGVAASCPAPGSVPPPPPDGGAPDGGGSGGDDGGCSCRVGSTGRSGGAAAFVVLCALVVRRRRRA